MSSKSLAPALLVCIALATSGCFTDLLGPQHQVSTTQLPEGIWNTDNTFRVVVGALEAPDPVSVRIRATGLGGEGVVENEGVGDVSLQIPDGKWRIEYWVDGDKWATLEPVWIDVHRPEPTGLDFVGDATDGSYTIGVGAVVEPGAAVEVLDQSGTVVATSLPAQMTGLGDGLHVFTVRITDEAGNTFQQDVQVRVGDATALPEGQYDFGIVARYTSQARLWDLSDLDAYMSVSQAQDALQGRYMGSGHGIDPDAPAVQAVVEQVVAAEMNTAKRALALYEWMFDNLEYDEERLETDTLLRPTQVITDSEDPGDEDQDGDGLVRDGPGNGVKGGVCRDLAATYVSLLRAAGVPARLVTGYLGGEVGGFHAWVEWYGGPLPGQDAWVPVDVSGIDGSYTDLAMMQSFGIERPDYLPLRALPPEAEVQGWSTSISVNYSWSGSSTPQVGSAKEVRDAFPPQAGVLCVDDQTLRRTLGSDESDCGAAGLPRYLTFTLRAERLLDYGIQVVQAPPGTDVKAEVAYPFTADVAPDKVAYSAYGPASHRDASTGKLVAQWQP